MTRKVRIIVATCIAVAALFWLTTLFQTKTGASKAEMPPREDAQHATPPVSSATSTIDGITDEERQHGEQVAAEIIAGEGHRFTVARVDAAYRRGKDEKERRQALSDLQDRRFPRAEAIRLLQAALADADLKVRLYAAELLYQLGSTAGREVLLTALHSITTGSLTAPAELLQAAEILNRYQEIIPPEFLLRLHELTGAPALIRIMAAQGDRAYDPLLLSAAERNPAGNVFNLGLAGTPGGLDVARQLFETAKNDRAKVSAAWTIYQLTSDRTALDFVMAVGEQKLTEKDGDRYLVADAVQEALRGLYLIKDTAVQGLLRQLIQLEDAAAANGALASLFYVQEDFDHVDKVVRDYLVSPTNFPQFDPTLIGRIAAVRNSAEISQLAAGTNRAFREHYLVPMQGLPPSSWIRLYLADVPVRR